MSDLTIQELVTATQKELSIKLVAGQKGMDRIIRVSEINRPGLALAGYFEYFRPERIQVFGQGESSFLQTMDNARRLEILTRIFRSAELPCILITHGREPVPELVELSNLNNIPIYSTKLTTADLIRELSAFLDHRLAPMTYVHGVLTVVYGLGVMLTGDSGIGKSECGLELVKREHILVADDLVEIRRHPGDILLGASGSSIQHYMEVRGLGIIDVRQIFGVSSVKDSARIELIVRLMQERGDDEFDRIGLEDHKTNILGVELPQLDLPLRPGRNAAVLVEVAALNQRLKQEGIYSAQELNKKLIAKMANGSKKGVGGNKT